ncbi:MAG: DsbA family oxidoreductase [Bacteroidota bacterium]
METKTMKVEIWSDITCMYCYTAKRKFESALSQFKDKNKIEVVWKSFELAPDLKTDPDRFFPAFLAELRGISLEQSREMIDGVANMVKEVGLEFNLHKSIPANSFNAHRLSHLAKHSQMQDKTEERLFKAYFTEGKNIDDIPTLVQLATEIGLDTSAVKKALESTDYANQVKADISEAKEAGITSVPFFIFNAKATISGAQESKVFLQTLERAFELWQAEETQSCEIGKDCI